MSDKSTVQGESELSDGSPNLPLTQFPGRFDHNFDVFGFFIMLAVPILSTSFYLSNDLPWLLLTASIGLAAAVGITFYVATHWSNQVVTVRNLEGLTGFQERCLPFKIGLPPLPSPPDTLTNRQLQKWGREVTAILDREYLARLASKVENNQFRLQPTEKSVP